MSTSLDVIDAMPSACTVAVLERLSGRDVMSRGMLALTAIDPLAPAASDAMVAVRTPPALSDAVSKELLDTVQLRRSAAGS
jgi:hypothetical protein